MFSLFFCPIKSQLLVTSVRSASLGSIRKKAQSNHVILTSLYTDTVLTKDF